MNNYRQPNNGRYPSRRPDGCAPSVPPTTCGAVCPDNTGCGMPGAGMQGGCSCSVPDGCPPFIGGPIPGGPGPVIPPNSVQSGLSRGCMGDMKNFPIAMSYVPWQSFCNLNDPRKALSCGTLFQDLYLDFYGRRCN